MVLFAWTIRVVQVVVIEQLGVSPQTMTDTCFDI